MFKVISKVRFEDMDTDHVFRMDCTEFGTALEHYIGKATDLARQVAYHNGQASVVLYGGRGEIHREMYISPKP